MPQLENIIRRETGLGPLNKNHIVWLQTLIKVAFRSKSSVFIFYREQQTNYIYLFPTNELNTKEPRFSDPIEKDEFESRKKDALDMLKEMQNKTEYFASLAPYYKIKIVRELPLKVKKCEKFNDQAYQ